MTVSVSIRGASIEDAPLVHSLARETFPLACPPGLSPSDIEAYLEETLSEESLRRLLSHPDTHIVVAWVGVEPAGWAMVVEGSPPPEIDAMLVGRPSLELSKFYVRQQWHGHGVAKALMGWVVGFAFSRGMASVWLGVNHGNSRAARFYEKHGFVVVGQKDFRLGSVVERDDVRERSLMDNIKN